MFKLKENRGFTLIELLVVIAIIGLLSSVVLASLNSAREKSRDARRISDVKQLQTAFEIFFDDQGAVPSYPAGTTGPAQVVSAGLMPQEPKDPRTNASYGYQGRSVTGAACATAPCYKYVVYTTLETNNAAALNDGSGSDVGGVNCAADQVYCVQP
ncbi:hypothetical protein COB52_03410 [Candidatus Kaiserbacteria bacterium]|nr:MAG: hypothetical protein COB52_03410 [Candidatus Kaiserbacteria bacterium]